TNVKAGTDNNDAVNVGQLKEAQKAATTKVEGGKGVSVTPTNNADGSTTYAVEAKTDNTTIKTDADGNLTANTAPITSTNGKAATTGDKNALATAGDVINAINSSGFTAKANGDAGKFIASGDSVDFINGDNIEITRDEGNFTIATAKDVKFDSVTTGDTTINKDGVKVGDNVSLTNSGLTAGDVKVTTDGINAGNKKITNVASGLNGKTLDEIKNDPNATERSNVATIGDLTTVQNNVTNINTTINKVIGGTTPDGKVTDTDGNVVTDSSGKELDVSDALKTYNVSGNEAKTDNTLITAIKNMNEGGIKFFHVNDGTGEQNIDGQEAHDEDSSASGAYASAVGYQAKASGENAIALGKGSQANAKNTIAIGTGNIVTGENSGAIGDPSIINGANSYSVGNNNTVATDNTFVLGNNVTQTLANSVILGDNSSAVAVNTTANGGNYTYAGANDANVSGVNDVVGVVSVGTDTQTRQIQNVAAGVVSATSTDAINGSQLYHTNEAITNLANNTINMGNQLNAKIDEVKDDANAGVSSAMAMAALPQAYIPGKSMLTGGMATYNGEGAVAVGLSKLSDNGRWVLKISGSADTQGNAGGAIGAGFHF
ncbi:MAG: YadA-like family protein, partial [Moraxella sp.]|nr:YadA-like family protein [Moraxella sp.]